MNITRVEREELKALSKEIFGKTSAYQRFLNGVPEVITKTVTEEVPGENGAEPTKKEVKVPVLMNGVKQSRIKYYSVQEVKELLVGFKKQLDDFKAEQLKMQTEAKLKKEQEQLQKQVQEQAHGSAV